MAVTQLTCPECGATLTLRSNVPLPSGSRIKCPKCGTSVRTDSPDDRPVRTVNAGPRRSTDDGADDDRPRARRRSDRYDDEEDDDRPRRRKRRPRDDDEEEPEGTSGGTMARYLVGAILLIAAIIVNYFIWTERAKKADTAKDRGEAAPTAPYVSPGPAAAHEPGRSAAYPA